MHISRVYQVLVRKHDLLLVSSGEGGAGSDTQRARHSSGSTMNVLMFVLWIDSDSHCLTWAADTVPAVVIYNITSNSDSTINIVTINRNRYSSVKLRVTHIVLHGRR